MKTNEDTKRITFSKRTRVRLPEDEFRILKEYVTGDPAAYATIAANTGVRRTTVISLIEKGYTQLETASKLKPVIQAVRDAKNIAL